jgi:hypothetical protein
LRPKESKYVAIRHKGAECPAMKVSNSRNTSYRRDASTSRDASKNRDINNNRKSGMLTSIMDACNRNARKGASESSEAIMDS